ncbi:MAG: epoxyalkane--coenzyme M transferase, partial [Candidatus Dormiibacterota bacterium]
PSMSTEGRDALRRDVGLAVEALNDAVRAIPPEQLRLHVCWGNYDGPHDHDVELNEIVDLVLRGRPAGLSIEAANPRHAHEWEVFAETRLPDDKYLIPGVVDSTNNYVEHPRVVAQRLVNYGRLVGRDRVMAGSDCGFGTFVGQNTVVPSVTWAKLRSMAEGARIAWQQLA